MLTHFHFFLLFNHKIYSFSSYPIEDCDTENVCFHNYCDNNKYINTICYYYYSNTLIPILQFTSYNGIANDYQLKPNK